jgi:hypothetical protein
MLSQYIAKCKYNFKMIQIIAKLDEILSHILNMNWLYHFNYNWKVWLVWFHKKRMHKFFIQMSISVLKENILLKNYFHLKDDKNYFGGLLSKSTLYIFQNARWNERKTTFKIYQNYTQKEYMFLPKATPHNVLSPLIFWKIQLSFTRDV